MIRIQPDDTLCGLAGSGADRHCLDAVVNGVSHEVDKRVGKSVKDAAIKFGIRAANLKLHLLAAELSGVANHARHAPKETADVDHANFQHGFLQLGDDARLRAERIKHAETQRVA